MGNGEKKYEGKVSSLMLWKEQLSLIGGGKKRERVYIEKLGVKWVGKKDGSQFQSMQKFTNEDPLVPAADMLDNEKFMIVEAWKQADFLCKCYILSSLEDDLYNVYSAMNTSKELWDALEKKYKTEDTCLKTFVVAKFLDYKMIDSKNLPSSWRDFKNYLKHKRQEMKLKDLVIRLKIEEDNKTTRKKSRGNSTIMGVNIVEKTALKTPDCRLPKKDKKKGHANIVEKNDDIDDLRAMLSKCNLVENLKEWRIDSKATQHVCAVKEAFTTYSTIGPEEELFLGKYYNS
ncbi:uncharacterized protein [Nicotiana tomentosiformis]|uniref:uncharacterized protein n=1 Tax=Nicotiana tomentosiformis TaxID=4098 RepID=UPI00388C832C